MGDRRLIIGLVVERRARRWLGSRNLYKNKGNPD